MCRSRTTLDLPIMFWCVLGTKSFTEQLWGMIVFSMRILFLLEQWFEHTFFFWEIWSDEWLINASTECLNLFEVSCGVGLEGEERLTTWISSWNHQLDCSQIVPLPCVKCDGFISPNLCASTSIKVSFSTFLSSWISSFWISLKKSPCSLNRGKRWDALDPLFYHYRAVNYVLTR